MSTQKYDIFIKPKKSLFSELKDAPPPSTEAPITTQTQKKFWEKKNPTKLVQTPFHERSRERFIDTITNTSKRNHVVIMNLRVLMMS